MAGGGPEALGEVLAGSHGLPRPQAQRHEELTAAQGMQTEAGFVVFRQARGVEYPAMPLVGQPLQGLPAESGSHPIGRQEAAQSLPRRNVLDLVFGELVAVDAVGDLAQRRRQREHRNLHHLIIPGEPVDEPQRLRIDEILGVVRHHDLKADALSGLVAFHGAVGVVQAIALGCGAVGGANGEVHPRVAAGRRAYGADGGPIIRINTCENLILAVANHGEIALQHLGDDALFAPQRHKNGDTALRSAVQLRRGRPSEPLARRIEVDQSDKQVIQPAQQDPDGQRD